MIDGGFMLRSGMIIDDDYCLIDCLGRGGVGEVWLADQASLGNQVALKFVRDLKIDQDVAYQLLKTEGQNLRALAALKGYGSNILYVNRAGRGTSEHPPYLDLELMKGGSLKQKLDRDKMLSQDDVVSCARQIISALLCAHGEKMIHGDIKPHNVLLSGDGKTVKLSDFGLARKFGQVSDSGWGTPMYMSPEHFRNPEKIGPASDIYSFGILLYQCIEGKPPFICDNRAEYEIAHCQKRAPSLANPSVDQNMREIVLDCLAKDPLQRPALEQLREQFERFYRGATIFESPPSLKYLTAIGTDTGGLPILRHSEANLEYRPAPSGSIYLPSRLITHLDYYRFVNNPACRSYQPGLMPLTEHDGGYLNNWYMGKPRKEDQNLPLGCITWKAANACAHWLGGRLPLQHELRDLFYGDEPCTLVRNYHDLLERCNYPYLAFWCRDYDSSSQPKPIWLLLPPASPLKNTKLVNVRRPGVFCFPHYVFLPVISTDSALNLANRGYDPFEGEGSFGDGIMKNRLSVTGWSEGGKTH